ncbi:MAG: type IV toxin-antitoxin system AbiEi family antitoxin domain-containing protein [Planctomycetes bacterium]|nr:type IV toxin-antitoxin system AbiEi family antitoxin domain-containing protein [Planctomycetota bacterium]
MPIRRSKLDRTALDKAKALFRKHGGMLRMANAIQAGIHRTTLYAMRDAGLVEQLSRGLYRLADAPPLANPDLVTVARRVPRGVVCLISALALHDLTTQIPHEVWLAVPRDSEPPRVNYPPIRVFRYANQPFAAGVETHDIDGTKVRVYNREKTLADCFKYRNKIGLDTVVEALKRYKQQGHIDADALTRYAQTCRVANVMRPYLEAVL